MKKKDKRKFLEKRYGFLYKRAMWLDQTVCVYCDKPRELLDHSPAISLVEGIDIKGYLRNGGEFLLYPSCAKCNSLLGSSTHVSLYDRLKFLFDKYNKKIDKVELWTDDELEEMGKNMRSFIVNQQYRVDELNNAITHIDQKIIDITCGDMSEDGTILKNE